MSSLPRPKLLRSLTFWGGLLAVVFTLWAWKDSVRHITTVSGGPLSITSKGCGLQIYHPESPVRLRLRATRGEVLISLLDGRFGELDTLRFGRPDLGGYLGLEARKEANLTGMQGGRRLDPVIRYYYSVPEDIYPGAWLLFIPYWCVLLGVGASWLGLIYWRSRRIQRALASDKSSARGEDLQEAPDGTVR